MQMRDPGGREEKYRERTGFATRSPKERKKSVLKFGILFEIHILSADIEKFSMIGTNIREFLNSTGKKTFRPTFQNFSKIAGQKLGDKKKKKSANVLTRDGQTLAWLAFFSARPGSPLNEGKNSLEFHSGGSPASNSIPDLLCPAAQCPEDSCAPSARRFLTNE